MRGPWQTKDRDERIAREGGRPVRERMPRSGRHELDDASIRAVVVEVLRGDWLTNRN